MGTSVLRRSRGFAGSHLGDHFIWLATRGRTGASGNAYLYTYSNADAYLHSHTDIYTDADAHADGNFYSDTNSLPSSDARCEGGKAGL